VKGTRPAIVATLMLSLGLFLPAAGCGDDEADQFREDYNAAVDELSQVNADLEQLSGATSSRTERRIASEFDRVADSTDRARRNLAKLEPPDDARDEFDALLGALKKGVADLQSFVDALEADDIQRRRRAVEKLAASTEEIAAAEDALKQEVGG
jgi:hypothetical protein